MKITAVRADRDATAPYLADYATKLDEGKQRCELVGVSRLRLLAA